MILEVVEGLQYMTSTEELSYQVTTTPWGSTPTLPVVVVYDEADESNVTTTVMPTNTPTVNGDIITLSALKLLVKNHTYRIEVKFTSSGNIFECYFRVHCEV